MATARRCVSPFGKGSAEQSHGRAESVNLLRVTPARAAAKETESVDQCQLTIGGTVRSAKSKSKDTDSFICLYSFVNVAIFK